METKPIPYRKQHLFDWLKANPIFNINFIESELELPSGTLRHFLNNRRSLPNIHETTVINFFSKYGYKPLEE